MSGKDKANIATQGSFAFGFPEFSKEQSLARRPDLTAAIARFEKWMDDTNSPVRAVRKIPARAAVTGGYPSECGRAPSNRAWRSVGFENCTHIKLNPSRLRKPERTL